MKKVFSLLLVVGLLIVCFTSLASAVWWNPFTWFDNDNYLVKDSHIIITKNTGLEKYVIMGRSISENQTHINLILTVDVSKFNWMADAIDNPTIEKCYTVEPILQEDNPNFDCSKQTHRELLLDKMTKFVNQGFKLKQKGQDVGYFDRIGDKIFITIDKKDLRTGSIAIGEDSFHFDYHKESITARNSGGDYLGRLSITTEDWEYLNGKPNIQLGIGEQKLIHSFYIENYNTSAITNLRIVNMHNLQNLERNANLKWLSYYEESVDVYVSVCDELAKNCTSQKNGTRLETRENWSSMDLAIEGENYVIGVFADTEEGDYADIDFDYYGISVLESPIDWATWQSSLYNGLEASWSFEETSGDVVDDLGNFSCTNNGATRGVTGVYNQAFNYTSTDPDYVTCGDVLDVNSGYGVTIVCWARPYSTGTFQQVIGKSNSAATNSWEMRIQDDGDLQCSFREGSSLDSAITTNNVNYGSWNFLACSRPSSGGTVKTYLNNDSAVTVSNSNRNTANSHDLRIGYSSGSVFPFNGDIDQCLVYSRELNSTEISKLANNYFYPLGPTDNPPVITNPLPTNNTVYTTTTMVNFNWTASDDINLESTAIFIDGVLEFNNTNPTNNSLQTYSKSLSSGIHNWSLVAYDNSTQNATAGPFFLNISISTPEVTLQAPEDNAFSTNATQELIAYVESENPVQNVTLYIDMVANETITTGANATNYTFTKTFAEGSYDWYVESCNNLGFCADSSTYTLNIDLNAPTIFANVTTPIIYNFGDNVSVDFQANDSFLDKCYYNYGIIDTAGSTQSTINTNNYFNYTSNATSGSSGDLFTNFLIGTGAFALSSGGSKISSLSDTPICNYSSLSSGSVLLTGNIGKYFCVQTAEGNYYINEIVSVSGSTSQTIGWKQFTPNEISCTSGVLQEINITSEAAYTDIDLYAIDQAERVAEANVNFSYDIQGPTINIIAPSGFEDYAYTNKTEFLNWTVTDINLDSCWYNYNGTNVSVNCNDNSTTFLLINKFNLTFYANDTLGNTNSEFTSWEYKVFEINQSYNSQTTEGSLEDFEANVVMGSGFSVVAAILEYDGESTFGESRINGEDTLIIKEDFVIVDVDADKNVSFYWNITLNDLSNIQLLPQNQSIFNLDIDNCSSYTNKLLSYTLKDEKTQVDLSNGIIETATNIYDRDRTRLLLNLSNLNTNVNPVEICLNRNITGDTIYSLDNIVRYEKEDTHANEYYNIVNYQVNSTSSTQEINLYDLNINDSTEFQLTFTGDDFLPEEDVLVFVERQYISENVFKTVELPKTDSNGQTVLHLVRNNVIYNLRMLKDGVVLGTFSNIIAFCDDFSIGDCKLSFNAIGNESLISDYDDQVGLVFSENTQYNETTRLATFSFASTDGTVKLVTMDIERRDVFGNISICTNSLAATSGTLVCQVPEGVEDTSLYSIISVSGVPKVNSVIIIEDEGLGANGYAMFFIMALGMVLMFSGSKTWTLIGLIVNYIAGVGLGLVVGGIAGVGSAGIFIIVISAIGLYQLNKERLQ